jgi:hypothetical protein
MPRLELPMSIPESIATGRLRNLFLIVGIVVALSSAAWSASPRLTTIVPRGAQRGQEHVLTFVGTHLKDAQEIFFYDDGLEVTKLAVEGANRLQATVRIAADCRLGEHVAQVRTASGISDYRPFYVGALADVAEQEPNSDPTTSQPVALNVTIRGIIKNEDVDYFAVDAKQGQRLCAEVEGIRLGDTLFDPYLAIMDPQEFVMAAADDTPLVHQDAIASIVVPRDGRYLVMLRDSAYGGSDKCHYRLHIGTFSTAKWNITSRYRGPPKSSSWGCHPRQPLPTWS